MSSTHAAQAAILISFFSLLSRITGFGREVVFAAFFGATPTMDAYIVAYMIPTLLGALIQMGITTAFIPVYNGYLAKQDEVEAKTFADTIMGCVGIIAIIIGIAGYLFAPEIVAFTAPGFSEEYRGLAVSLTRLMLPIILFSGLLGCTTAIQQAHNRFFFPAIVGTVANIIIIVTVAIFSARFGIYSVAGAVTLAVIIQLAIQYPGLRKCSYRPGFSLNLSHPGIKAVGLLIIPVMIGTAANQINLFVDRILASSLAPGSIAALTYASRINDVFLGVFVISIITVVFPKLAQYAALKQMDSFKHTLNLTIRLIAFVIIPVMAILITFRVPIVQIIFQRGAFDDSATIATAYALLFFPIGLLGTGLVDLLNKTFYALQNTRIPVFVTVFMVLINICFNLLLVRSLAQGGLALATSIAALTGAATLLYLFTKKFGSIGETKILLSLGKISLAAIVMSILGHSSFLLANTHLAMVGAYGRLVALVVCVLGSLVAYCFILSVLKAEEISYVAKLLFARIQALR